MAPHIHLGLDANGVHGGPVVMMSAGLCAEPPNFSDSGSAPGPVEGEPLHFPAVQNSCTEIPSESLLRAPVRSMLAMPSRLSLSRSGQAVSRPGLSRQPLIPHPALEGIFVDPAVWPDELPVALEASTFPPMPQRLTATRPYVGASHNRIGLTQQRPGARRVPPSASFAAGATWHASAPPQGDGAVTYSRSSSSNSLPDPDFELDFMPDYHGRPSSQGHDLSLHEPHEDVANEEPLAHMPVRVVLRSARSHRDGDGVRSDLHRSPMEALGAAPNTELPPLPMEWSSSWQVADELGHAGGMAAPRYLLVRLGECIPAETGAAPVHLSRLDTGPQWRDFLNYGEGRGTRGCLALDELLACPCCLLIYRQPVALPCGHSLCRSCLARISAEPPPMRRCPLCRADFPTCDLKVNLALSAVCDSLRAFRALEAATRGSAVFELRDDAAQVLGLSGDDAAAQGGSPSSDDSLPQPDDSSVPVPGLTGDHRITQPVSLSGDVASLPELDDNSAPGLLDVAASASTVDVDSAQLPGPVRDDQQAWPSASEVLIETPAPLLPACADREAENVSLATPCSSEASATSLVSPRSRERQHSSLPHDATRVADFNEATPRSSEASATSPAAHSRERQFSGLPTVSHDATRVPDFNEDPSGIHGISDETTQEDPSEIHGMGDETTQEGL